MNDLHDQNAKQTKAYESENPSRGAFTFAPESRPLQGYTIEAGIGTGGFGEVYRAVSDGGKRVALKYVRRNADIELRGIGECLNLKHPHLLAIHDIRQSSDGAMWVVMEHVEGQELADVIAAHPQGMPLPEVLSWLHSIGGAVQYLHDRDIVHRDLKPTNVFCDDGIVKLGDYGLAKSMAAGCRHGHTEGLGSVCYLAPEIANGQYDRRIDIYALGIILFEMITGRVPFDGETSGEVLMKHITSAPDLSDLPRPYRAVLARALEKDPSRRYSSVAEMLAALPEPPGRPVVAVVASGKKPDVVMAQAADGSGRQARRGTDRPGRPQSVTPITEPEVLEDCETVKAAVAPMPAPPAAIPAFPSAKPVQVTPWQKVGIVMAALFLSFFINRGLFALVLLAAICYGVFEFFRMLFTYLLADSPVATVGPTPARVDPIVQARAVPEVRTQPRAAPRVGPPSPFVTPHQREVARRAALGRRPVRARAADLVGSMILAALAVIPMCIVMVLLQSAWQEDLSRQMVWVGPVPVQMVWVGAVSVLGAWSVLLLSKVWEPRMGEGLPRRFIGMVVGMVVGAIAAGLAAFLMMELPYDVDWGTVAAKAPSEIFYGPDGQPRLMAMMAVFGIMMGAIRWWKLADPLRRKRLSLWSLFCCYIITLFVAAVCQFPQPWLIMVACSMAVAIQLAAPRPWAQES